MKVQTKQVVTMTKNFGDRLKSNVEKELARLQEALDGLTAKERIDVAIKLMPLVVLNRFVTKMANRQSGTHSVI